MRRELIFLLCLALSWPWLPVRPLAAHAAPDAYTFVAENDALRLFVNEENLGIILEEKATGLRLGSICADTDNVSSVSWKGFMESGFALEFYNAGMPLPERLDAYNGRPELRVEKTEGGFAAHVHYADSGLSFVLELSLTEDGFRAGVPADSLVETEQARIGAIYLYPFLGASRRGEKAGYMLIPEGAGALIDLGDNAGKFKTPYQKRVYGDNRGTMGQAVPAFGWMAPKEPTAILSPFYGIAHTDEQLGFLAIVEEGQYNVEILAYPNGVTTDYDWVTARFLYRERYNMQISRSRAVPTSEAVPYFRDLSVRYYFLSGEAASYMGMAEKYRENRVENGLLDKKDTSYKSRLDFLGAEAEAWLFGQRSVSMTSISEMEEIISRLAAAGRSDILAIYKGWQPGGLSKSLGSANFSLSRAMGSTNALYALAGQLADGGGQLILHQDLLRANPGRFYNTGSDIAKGINQIIIEEQTYSVPFDKFYFLTPKRSLELSELLGRQFADLGFAVGGIGKQLFSYYAESRVFSRGDCAEGHIAAVRSLAGPGLALEQPFDYLWEQTDHFLDMPLYTSGYSFITAEIPFLPIVLKSWLPYYADYLNFEANERLFFLKMVEYGAYPSFLITWESPVRLRETNAADVYSSEFDVYEERIVAYGEELQHITELSENAGIVGHVLLSPEASLVRYGNGLEIVVNFGQAAIEYQGVPVAAESYVLIKGGELL